MLLPRIIPCLLLKGRGLVKGVRFKNHVYVGDPINTVEIFNTKEVDELLFLDITATHEKRIPSLELIQQLADECLMPFSVGGGIRSIQHIRDILSQGAEKVCINTAAVENPGLIQEASKYFGSQSIIVSIDFKQNRRNQYELYIRCGKKRVRQLEMLSFIQQMEELGVGEILLNSIDRDGTMSGYDLELIQTVSDQVKVPLIALGGAWTDQELKDGIEVGGASAVAAGSKFVFHGERRAVLINYPDHNALIEIRGN